MRNRAEVETELSQHRLEHIEYELLEWETAPEIGNEVDEVSTAVTLHFGNNGRLRFHCQLRLPIECLAIGDWEPGDPSTTTRTVDVTDRWPNYRGDILRRLSFALQGGDAGPQSWACRLIFGSGKSLVIALGEIAYGEVTYIPDQLIVTNSRRVAERYRPPAAWDDAWGKHSG